MRSGGVAPDIDARSKNGGPTLSEIHELGGMVLGVAEQLVGLLESHGQLSAIHLEHFAIENAPRGRPAWPLAGDEKHVDRSLKQQGFNKALRGPRSGNGVIVVEYKPSAQAAKPQGRRQASPRANQPHPPAFRSRVFGRSKHRRRPVRPRRPPPSIRRPTPQRLWTQASPVYQAEVFPSSHCLASVVFPYPAGATSILILPWLSSSRVVNRGRSMIRRRLTGGLGAVPSPMSRWRTPQSPL